MVFKTTFTDSRKKGFTFLELMLAIGIGTMALAVLGISTEMMLKSFDSMANYVELEQQSRNTLDTISREIRQANKLTYFSDTALIFEDNDGQPLYYLYSEGSGTLYKLKNSKLDVLLEGCEYLTFSIYQRNPKQGTYDQYPTATPVTCKLVQLNWKCTRENFGGNDNTEIVQSAKFVIRNQ